jgi:hypothetical protein
MKIRTYLSSTLAVFITFLSISAQGQTPVSPTLTRAIKRVVGERPQMVFWGDLVSFRNSSFFAPVKSLITKSMQKMVKKTGNCTAPLTADKVDYVLATMSDSDNKKKQRGMVILQGSFSSSTLISCLAIKNKWTKTTFKGYPAWKEKGNKIYFTPSMGSLVALVGKWAKKIKPGKGIFGKGTIKSLATSKFLIVDIIKFKSLKPIENIKLYGTIGTQMKFKFELKHSTTKGAKDLEKKALTMKKMPPPFSTFAAPLKIRRSGKRVFVKYAMTVKQLTSLMKIVSPLLP